jgi:hypothetical protein
LSAICSRSFGTPVIGAYWLRPSARARERVAQLLRPVEIRKALPRFTAPCCTASWLMTVKIVVPTLGSLVSICMDVQIAAKDPGC